jgi:hypothetical protein
VGRQWEGCTVARTRQLRSESVWWLGETNRMRWGIDYIIGFLVLVSFLLMARMSRTFAHIVVVELFGSHSVSRLSRDGLSRWASHGIKTQTIVP